MSTCTADPAAAVVTASDRAAVAAGCYFDAEIADAACAFIETFLVPTRGYGAGRKTRLQPWQRTFIRRFFGWMKPGGLRRYRMSFLGIPRQNGKSFMASAISLAMLIFDREPGAYCVVAAVTGDQTEVVFGEVLASVERSPRLMGLGLRLVPSRREIRYPKRHSVLKGLSSEGWGKLGNPPHCAILDEFCFWKRYDAYEALKTGMDSRKQPLLLAISTSGHDRTTPAYELWQYALAVANSDVVDVAFLPQIYAAPQGDPIHAPGVWEDANPSLGVTVKMEETAAWSERAKHSKVEELQFRQYRLNQWCNSTRQFLNLDALAACEVVLSEWPDLAGLPAYVGVDLAQTRDLVSVVVIVPHLGRWWLRHHSFSCAEAVKRREAQNEARYSLFEAEGTLTQCGGNLIDFEQVRDHIRGLCSAYDVRKVAFDPREASDTATILAAEGLPCELYPPGPLYFDTPMRRLESAVNAGVLAHDGSRLLTWQAQNLEAKTDWRELMAPKKPDGNNGAKIDTWYAALVAVAQLVKGEAEARAADFQSSLAVMHFDDGG